MPLSLPMRTAIDAAYDMAVTGNGTGWAKFKTLKDSQSKIYLTREVDRNQSEFVRIEVVQRQVDFDVVPSITAEK